VIADALRVEMPSAANGPKQVYYYHNDHLGTPQLLTDQQQSVVWQGRYTPFGEVTETISLVEQPLRFPGQYFDEETGLHHNYFRDYDPSLGRYLQSDPLGLFDGPNTYAYAGNSPVMYIDFYGLYKCSCLAEGLGGGSGRNDDGMKLCNYTCRCTCENGETKTVTVQGQSSSLGGGEYVCLGAITGTTAAPTGQLFHYAIRFERFSVDTDSKWYHFGRKNMLQRNLSDAMDQECEECQ